MRNRLVTSVLSTFLILSACKQEKAEPKTAAPLAAEKAPPSASSTASVAKVASPSGAVAEGYGGGEHEHKEKERDTVAVAKPVSIILDGKASGERSASQLDALDPNTKPDEQGKHTWSLRLLARSVGGAKARVVAVGNEDKQRLELDKAAWNDAQRTPTLRSNRRGDIKFQWEKNGGPMPMEPELRGIQTVEIVSGG